MTIYIHGCECGTNSIYIKKIKALNDSVEVINSKYDELSRKDHSMYLRMAGFSSDGYQPIVVEGDKITLLRLWKF